MTRTTFESTSVEAAIREAEMAGATRDEAREIHRLVAANTDPAIHGFELEFGRDAMDNDAVWVHLIVESDLKPSPQKISAFNDAAKKVRTALLQANLRVWPYVDIRGRIDAPQRSH